MKKLRIMTFAIACVSVAAIGLRTALERVSETIWSVLAFFVRTVAYPPQFAFAGGPEDPAAISSYHAPPQSFIRHEAGVKKRSSARHI